MNNLLKDSKRVHFIGIGGISMSGLAETLHKKGFIVSGSDNKESDIIAKLRNTGINVVIGQSAKNITDDIGIAVYTAAIKGDNPEYREAIAKNKVVIDRAQLMGIIMDEYKRPICVSGTHGKTTTTSMICEIFITAAKDPTINLGGILPSINNNYLIGNSDYFIAESCEYYNSFLRFHPHHGVILNIELDHLDYFKDLAHIEDSFHKFAQNIHDEGALIIDYSIDCRDRITKDLKCRVITYGNERADWFWNNIAYDEKGFASFDLFHNKESLGRIHLSVGGEHNISNAVAAIVVSFENNISIDYIKAGLVSFGGTKRRYEIKGYINGITIIDDYAHHPTEIKATLASAKNSPHKNLYCVFQPHTYTRTKHLLQELSQSFNMADYTVIVDIYSAREKDLGEVHAKDLAKLIKKQGQKAIYFSSFKETEKFLLDNCGEGDLLITMGAGDVHLVGENMLHTELSPISPK